LNTSCAVFVAYPSERTFGLQESKRGGGVPWVAERLLDSQMGTVVRVVSIFYVSVIVLV
jgi:hypothetical protein